MGRTGFTSLWLVVAGCAGAGGAGAGGDDDELPVIDAAPVAIDAAPPDGAAGYGSALVACDDALADLYVTPAGLPPLTPATRGDVVRCARGRVLDAAAVAATTADAGATVATTTGVRVYKVAYRSVRGDGSAAVTTATVWLPDTPRAMPNEGFGARLRADAERPPVGLAPIALVARSTSGIADGCAPSHEELPMANLGLPLAARGFVAIAPDFAGLGNEGVHAYLDNREAASQLFDGVRALRALTGGLGAPVIAIGYSQGGGIVLSAQGLEQELTGARTLRGVVAIAPEWPIRIGSFGYERVLRNPDLITGTTGLAPPTVTVLRQYGWFANRLGADRAGDSFPAAERADIIDSVERLCTVALGGALGAGQPRVRDLVDDGFRVAMLACIDGGAGCVEPARGFHQWLQANVVAADPAGARVLVVQGLADQVMPAASEAACVVGALRSAGVAPDVCSDTFATHDSILENKIEHAVAWLEATADGSPPPSCASSFLPPCAP